MGCMNIIESEKHNIYSVACNKIALHQTMTRELC